MLNLLQILTIVLVTGVIFVNGWTDAPNAIATAVGTKAISYRKAVGLATVCNLSGVLVMSFLNSSVANIIIRMVDYGGVSQRHAAISLCAGMCSVVVFAVAAWKFGIPTSESHALVAGLAGAGVALKGWAGLSVNSLIRVGIGLAVSLIAGFAAGWLLTRLLAFLKYASARFLDGFQICAASANAFMHGAQDGQKFIGVFVAAELLAKGEYRYGTVEIRDHLLVAVLCACVMALGTSVGGGRIIRGIGKLSPLEKYQGVCADIASVLCLLTGSWTGLPMSTTHTKTMAVIGSGYAKDPLTLSWKKAAEMLIAWAVTFPACGLLGWLLTKMLLRRL